MKVEELRIGNLVEERGDYVAVGFRSFQYMKENEKLFFSYVKPIPLTEEWFRRIGDTKFKFVGFGTRLIIQCIKFPVLKYEFCGNDTISVYFNNKLINYKKYVHDWQNIHYALTGEELKISNLVYIGEPVKGCEIELTRDNYENLILFNTFDRLSPIPLTEEWLLRMGFEIFTIKNELANKGYRIGEYFSLQDLGNGVYRLYKPTSYAIGSDNTHVKYVHQLQNLYYALTGEELKIEELTKKQQDF